MHKSRFRKKNLKGREEERRKCGIEKG